MLMIINHQGNASYQQQGFNMVFTKVINHQVSFNKAFWEPLIPGRGQDPLDNQHVQVHWCFCTSAPSLSLDLLS